MYWINIEKIGYISKISDIFDFFRYFRFFLKKNHDFFHPWLYAGWYLRQKPVGGSKAGGLPHPSLSAFPPLPLSIPA